MTIATLFLVLGFRIGFSLAGLFAVREEENSLIVFTKLPPGIGIFLLIFYLTVVLCCHPSIVPPILPATYKTKEDTRADNLQHVFLVGIFLRVTYSGFWKHVFWSSPNTQYLLQTLHVLCFFLYQ